MRRTAIFIDEENLYGWIKKTYESKHQHQSPDLELLSKSIESTKLKFTRYFDIDKLWEYLNERGFKISKAVCFIAQPCLKQLDVVKRLYERGIKIVPAIRYEYGHNKDKELKSLLDAMMIVEILTTAYENKHICNSFR